MNNVHYANLLKMLTNVDGPIVLTPSGKMALRWAISMINVLGNKAADQCGLPIPEVLARAAATVEASEEWHYYESK